MENPPPTYWARRLGAAVYEVFTLFAVAFVATVPWVALLPEHVVSAGNPWFQVYLLLVFQLYFALCWKNGGQTLGMRAWRLCVVTEEGQALSWKQALLRYWVALLSWLPLGLGYWWMFVDTRRLTWHDRASGTRLVYYPKS